MQRPFLNEPSDGAHYDLVRRVARGAAAEVWIARARTASGQKKTVVLKTIVAADGAEDMVSRILASAASAAELDHPTIARLLHVGELGEADCVALEYVPGRTLGQIRRGLRPRGLVPPLWFSLAVFCSLCDGLEHAHDRGLAHRHLCPELLAVSFTGVPKVLDLGVADDFAVRPSRQATPRRSYRAPELIGEAAASADGARADVFALGVILFELLTGQHPYPDLDPASGRALPPPPLASKVAPWVPETLDSVLLMALAASPADRYESVGQLRAALHAQLGALAVAPTTHNLAAYVVQLFGAPALADVETAPSVAVGQIPGSASCATDEPEPEGPPIEGFDSAPLLDLSDVLSGPDREAWNRLGAEDAPLSRSGRRAATPPAPAVAPREPTATAGSPRAAEPPRIDAPELPRARGAGRGPYLVGGAVIAALAVAFVVSRGSPEPARPPAPATSTAGPRVDEPRSASSAVTSLAPAGAEVEIVILASPPEAKLFLDDAPLGDNPFRGRVKRDNALHRIRAQAEGHAPAEESVAFDRDQTIRLKLPAEARPVAAPGPRPRAPADAGPRAADAPAPPGRAPQAGDDLQKTAPPPPKPIDRKDPYAP